MRRMQKRLSIFFQYKDLLKQLVARDVKLKYRRSILGYIWSVLNPLFIMIVMTLVFSHMLDNRGIENFPVYLLTGRTMFEFMTSSTNASLRSIVGNAALIKKCYVPKYIFTLARVTSCMVDFVFSFGALVIVMIFTKAPVTPYALLVPLVIIQIYIFCCGFGFLLAWLNVYFRDIQQVWKAITTAWLYATPIFYQIDKLPDRIQYVVERFNPLYYYITQFRDFVYLGRFPEARIFWGGWIMAIVALVIGVWSFQKNQDKFILYI